MNSFTYLALTGFVSYAQAQLPIIDQVPVEKTCNGPLMRLLREGKGQVPVIGDKFTDISFPADTTSLSAT